MDATSTEATHHPTLLVVDDEPANLAVLASLLQPFYRVRAVNSGARALNAAKSEPKPDLILLDVMMPELDGYGVLERLKSEENTRNIPVIFVTTLDETDDEERGLKLGAVDYITKPIKPAILLARVQTQLALKEARDKLSKQNDYLESEVLRRTRENVLVQDVSLSVIAGLVETRDTDTGNHTMRTQAYVEVLANKLLLDPKYTSLLSRGAVTRLVKAAPLHDIGKIGIPDHILLKPGPLTRDEFEIMKRHAALGGEAIEHAIERSLTLQPEVVSHKADTLRFLETARDVARWHHEKWAGGGYPDSLSGTSIPLGARLMAVADVFDALTTRRVYKPPMPIEKAIAIIVEGRGQQFDPDIVEAFMAASSEFTAIERRYADGVS